MINRKTSEIFAPFGGHQNHCLFLCAKLSKLTASPGWVGNRKPKSHRDLASTLCAQFHPRLFGLTRVATIDLGAEINSSKPTPGEHSRRTVVRCGTSRFSIWTWSPPSSPSTPSTASPSDAGRTHDRRELEQAVWAREDLYSTGLGFGFATPHCKTDAVTANSIDVLRPQSPINWGAADQEPVRMIILIAIREQKAAHNHLQVFSELARKLMNEDFRERLLKMQNASTILQYLAGELSLS